MELISVVLRSIVILGDLQAPYGGCQYCSIFTKTAFILILKTVENCLAVTDVLLSDLRKFYFKSENYTDYSLVDSFLIPRLFLFTRKKILLLFPKHLITIISKLYGTGLGSCQNFICHLDIKNNGLYNTI